ncbi:MAG: hypothetical protein IIA45_10955 [Bacteroidetes bacterium]|nr:hypothetical protein [Bacteroidota bacterium]
MKVKTKIQEKTISSRLQKQLAAYSTSALAILAISPANASIIYTDVNPDKLYNKNNDSFFIDLNNDNVNDFKINLYKSFGTYYGVSYQVNVLQIQPMNNNAVAGFKSYFTVGTYSGSRSAAYALNFNDSIGSSKNWSGSFTSLYFGAFYAFGSATLAAGEWNNVQDRYIGLRLEITGNIYYGWARFDVGSKFASITFKDYAYEDVIQKPILAGDAVSPDPVSNVVATDVANNNDPSDMQVAFDKASDENKVDSYRIFVIKSSDTTGFTLSLANGLPLTQYTHVPKTGSDLQANLNQLVTDKDGDAIVNGVPYKVYVLTVADGVNAGKNALSIISNEITLENTSSIEDPVINNFASVYSFGNTVYLNFNSDIHPEGMVTVYDLYGRELKKQSLSGKQMQINMGETANKIVLVRLDLNGRLLTKKIYLH